MLTLATQSTVAAQQFYNGDLDGADALYSAMTASAGGMVYENFTVGGSGLYVTGLFGQYTADFLWTTATWEVRSGVSSGNGGSLLFSGVDAATQVATGGSAFGNSIYNASVSGLNFFLTPGEYWFALAPTSAGTGIGYMTTTSGLNGQNANLDGLSYFNGAYFGEDFTESYIPGANFSLGVNGRLVESTVPEPATMTLLATGLAGLASARRRKRSNA
jgi:hypothetical protein